MTLTWSFRRDQATEALDDAKKAAALEPTNRDAVSAAARLEKAATEKLEVQKEEMMGKLKDLGWVPTPPSPPPGPQHPLLHPPTMLPSPCLQAPLPCPRPTRPVRHTDADPELAPEPEP